MNAGDGTGASAKKSGKVSALVAAFDGGAVAASTSGPKLTRDSYRTTASKFAFPTGAEQTQQSKLPTMSRSRTQVPTAIKNEAAPKTDRPPPIHSQTDLALSSKEPYKSPYAFAPIPVKKTASSRKQSASSVLSSGSNTSRPDGSGKYTLGNGYVSPYAYRPNSRASTPKPQADIETQIAGDGVSIVRDPSSRISTGVSGSAMSRGKSASKSNNLTRLSPDRAESTSSAGTTAASGRVRRSSLILSTSITQQKPQWRYTTATNVSSESKPLYKAVSTAAVPKSPSSPVPGRSKVSAAVNAYTTKLSGITSTATVTLAARNQVAAGLPSKDVKRPPASLVVSKTKSSAGSGLMTPTTIRVPSKGAPSAVNQSLSPASHRKDKIEGRIDAKSSKLTQSSPLSPPSMSRSTASSKKVNASVTRKNAVDVFVPSLAPAAEPAKMGAEANSSTSDSNGSNTKVTEIIPDIVILEPLLPDSVTPSTIVKPLDSSESVSVGSEATPLVAINITAAPVDSNLEAAAILPVETFESSTVLQSGLSKTEVVDPEAMVHEVANPAAHLNTDNDKFVVTKPMTDDATAPTPISKVDETIVDEFPNDPARQTAPVIEQNDTCVHEKVAVSDSDKDLESDSEVIAGDSTITVIADQGILTASSAPKPRNESTDATTTSSSTIPEIHQTVTPPTSPFVSQKTSLQDISIATAVAIRSPSLENFVPEEKRPMLENTKVLIESEDVLSDLNGGSSWHTPDSPDIVRERPSNNLMRDDSMEFDSNLDQNVPVESTNLDFMDVDDASKPTLLKVEECVPVERVSLSDLMLEQERMDEVNAPVERVSLHDLTVLRENEPLHTDILTELLTERHVPVERITMDGLLKQKEFDERSDSTASKLSHEVENGQDRILPPARKTIYDSKPFKLPDFTLVKTIGTGSFGRVHLALHNNTNTYVALKVLRKHDVVKLKQIEHTIDEKRILEALSNGCPFLVHLYGSFMDNEHLYLVLEYIPGGELFTYLRNVDKLDNEAAKFYAAEVVLAFEYLHSADVVYRDLKPENLLIDLNGHIRVTDFGFAKHLNGQLTHTLCGTPDYLAPEVIQTKGYGKAVDWWALGILIYEMIAGHPPFFDDDPFRLYEKIVACRLAFPPFMHPLAKDLIRKLLTPDLSRRYGNLRDGALDIKLHPWFQGVDWDAVWELRVLAPYIPQVIGESDTSHFDEYEEDFPKYGRQAPDIYKDKFKDF